MFDIDLTDYDDVRTCGDGGHICSRCWPFMALAIKVSGLGLWKLSNAQQSRHCHLSCLWLTPWGASTFSSVDSGLKDVRVRAEILHMPYPCLCGLFCSS